LKESEERSRAVAQSAIDAIISINRHGTIVFWNRAAKKMFGFSEDEILGKSLERLIPERYRTAHSRGIKRLSSTGESRVIGKTVELQGLRKDGSEFPLELSLATWKSKDEIFFTGIVRDITARKRAEEERNELIKELQEVLAKLETLSGLLPICANCKKIRDDKGYWNQIETYIENHSRAEFTHGICPDCIKKLYPDLKLKDDEDREAAT
jgi:PAS domain S-box-containing protein